MIGLITYIFSYYIANINSGDWYETLPVAAGPQRGNEYFSITRTMDVSHQRHEYYILKGLAAVITIVIYSFANMILV